MYAIVGVAGFQYKVTENQVLRVPLLDFAEGAKVTLDNVLLISDGKGTVVGQPTVSGATIEAEVVKHGRTRKTLAAVFKKRKDYRRRWGFRADFTEIKVNAIQRG